MEKIYRLEGGIVPKARPRVTRRGTFMPQDYVDWKSDAIDSLQRQHKGDPISVPVECELILIGKHSRRGDIDNVAGSIMDALVQAEVLVDDNLLRMPSASVRLFWGKGDAIALIKLTEATNTDIPDWAKVYL